ncbi:MAG: hypothetical protein O2945_11585 [Planctomycetota bacterium]|nr:hypothetical protein [Planctomycetota bacterium]
MRTVFLVISAVISIVAVSIVTGRPPQGPAGMAFYAMPGALLMFFLSEPLLSGFEEQDKNVERSKCRPTVRSRKLERVEATAKRKLQAERAEHGENRRKRLNIQATPTVDAEVKKWMCRIDGREMGPVSDSALVKLHEAGTLAVDDSVRQQSTEAWRNARDVLAELAAADHARLSDSIRTSDTSGSASETVSVSDDPDSYTVASKTYSLAVTDSELKPEDNFAGFRPSDVAEKDFEEAPTLNVAQGNGDSELEHPSGCDDAEVSEGESSGHEANLLEDDLFRTDMKALVLDCLTLPLQPECLRTVMRMSVGWFVSNALTFFAVFLALGMLTVTLQTVPALAGVPAIVTIAYLCPVAALLLVMMSYAAVCCLEVFAQTTADVRVIGEYPEGLDVGELFRGAMTLSVVWIAALPAASWVYGSPGVFSVTGLVSCSLCAFLLLPVIASCFTFDALVVARSLFEQCKLWGQFYALAILLVLSAIFSSVVLYFLVLWCVMPLVVRSERLIGQWPTLLWVIFAIPAMWTLASLMATQVAFIYSRLLGQLVRSISRDEPIANDTP